MAKILQYIKDYDDAYAAGDLLYFVPETLLSLQKNINIYDWDYQHSVPNQDIILLHSNEDNINSVMNKLLYHSQCIRAEYCASVDVTATASAPIASGLYPMTTFPEAPLSDTSEYLSILILKLLSDKPVEEPTSVPHYVPRYFPSSE